MAVTMRIDKIIALIISLLIVISAFIYFSLSLSTTSIIEKNEKYSIENIIDNSQIRRNAFGIPLITAKNENDLYFAIGYAHAFDRLFQLDITRRRAKGELSEVLGKNYVYQDMFIRTFDLEVIAKKSFENTDPKIKDILNIYSAGINFFIETHKNRLSIEFSELQYKPQQWQPWESYLIMKYLALSYSRSIKTDIIMSNIAATEGLEKSINLLPKIDGFDVENIDKELIEYYKKNEIPIFNTKEDYINSEFNENTGSVSWAVSNDSTFMMTTDLHTSFEIPNRFYQAFIENKNFRSFQIMIPGIPFGLVNSKKDIHWSIINGAFDDFDFVIEKVNNDQYYIADSLAKIKYVKDTIKIKDDTEKLYYKRYTDISAIISDVHYDSVSLGNNTITESMNKISSEEIVYTFNWSGKEISDEIKVLYEMSNISNIEDIQKTFSNWSSPPAVLVCSDKNQTKKFYSGLIPNRKGSLPSVFPIPKNDDNFEYNFTNFFEIVDSDESISVASNEMMNQFKNSKYGYLFDMKYLNKHINFLLEQQSNLNPQNAKYLQNDQLSTFAQFFFYKLTNQLSEYEEIMTKEEKIILQILQKWDYIIQYDSPITLFYLKYIDNLIDNIFYDNLNNYNILRYKTMPNIILSKLVDISYQDEAYFVDDDNTSEVENIKYLLFNTYRSTCNLFSIKENNITFNDNYSLPLAKPYHVLTEKSLMSDYIEFKKFNLGGDFSSVKSIDKNTFNGNKIIIGPTLRLISDLNEGVIYTSVLGGTSGDPVNPNFSDQLQLWLNGGYIKISFDDLDNFEIFTTFNSN